MSRSGLFRAAALLAASASPLLVGSANAAETPDLKGIAPEAGAAESVVPLVQDATKGTNPMDATKAVKLPSVKAPAAPEAPALPETPAAERSLPVNGLPIGTLPKLPDTDAVPNAKVGDLKVPAASQLPGVADVQGQLPSLG